MPISSKIRAYVTQEVSFSGFAQHLKISTSTIVGLLGFNARVLIMKTLRHIFLVLSGAPQGSIIRPVFFYLLDDREALPNINSSKKLPQNKT